MVQGVRCCLGARARERLKDGRNGREKVSHFGVKLRDYYSLTWMVRMFEMQKLSQAIT